MLGLDAIKFEINECNDQWKLFASLFLNVSCDFQGPSL